MIKMRNKQLKKHYSGKEKHELCLTCEAIVSKELIEEFLYKWEGLKYLCRDDDGAWEYWLKIYKEYEGRLK